jgi:hypothetical protein
MAGSLLDRVVRGGRHRRPDPPASVTVVLADGREVAVPPESALGKAMSQVAALLAHW